MMKSLLIFIPSKLKTEKSGYMFGKVKHDADGVKKFYVIGIRKTNSFESTKYGGDLIGYYCNEEKFSGSTHKKYVNWINIYKCFPEESKNVINEYCIKSAIINNKIISMQLYHTIIIIYDQLALQENELFISKSLTADHFFELMKILQSDPIKNEIKKTSKLISVKETILIYQMCLCFYPILFLSKIINKLLPILKYSSLGLHINGWLENMKWMLVTIIQMKRFSLKTGNHIIVTIIDMILGIVMVQLLLHTIEDTLPSEILLSNAEKVVNSLKNVISWLMGAPAGLKLNYDFNNILGRFFLYHIHLWWTFLIFMKPVMDFAFKILFLFGNLGITFQIAIAADLLAIISFHTYCIYVYAARLFNIQLCGLIALFRLFVGKKKNPLRERVDSCQYQPDQLFIGTLIFTILLFLMPTTWVYYTVFTVFRLLLIGFGGLLTRVKFYLQIIPVYTFIKWLFRSHSVRSVVNIELCSVNRKRPVIVAMSLTNAPWSKTWHRCIPDTINVHPPIKWNMIFQNIIWGQLLYPL